LNEDLSCGNLKIGKTPILLVINSIKTIFIGKILVNAKLYAYLANALIEKGKAQGIFVGKCVEMWEFFPTFVYIDS
jgi:hypothetical protein